MGCVSQHCPILLKSLNDLKQCACMHGMVCKSILCLKKKIAGIYRRPAATTRPQLAAGKKYKKMVRRSPLLKKREDNVYMSHIGGVLVTSSCSTCVMCYLTKLHVMLAGSWLLQLVTTFKKKKNMNSAHSYRCLTEREFAQMLQCNCIFSFLWCQALLHVQDSQFCHTYICLCHWFQYENLEHPTNFIRYSGITAQPNLMFGRVVMTGMASFSFQICLVYTLTERKYLRFEWKPAATTLTQMNSKHTAVLWMELVFFFCGL